MNGAGTGLVAGVVADSDPVAEGQERRDKAAILTLRYAGTPIGTVCGAVQPVKAAVPFGTPSPVGPS